MTQPDPGPDGDDRRARNDLQPDRSDQLSPNRALQESLGSSISQRVGDNGPLANPVVSFPDEPGDEAAGAI